MVKGFASVTSPDWWREVKRVAPNAIQVLVHGEISDNPDLSRPEQDAEDTARLLDSRPGFPRLVISKNELLHSTHPLEHWALWSDYMRRWITRAHQLGFNGVVGQINSGHPSTYLIDGSDQWQRLRDVDTAMNSGDYWGLHEYWGMAGPRAWWPWTCGRHMMMPFSHNILIDECGFDKYTDGPEPDIRKRGWAANLNKEQYVDQVVEYHRLITDPRVKGTALFLMDYDNNEWLSFDSYPVAEELRARRDECAEPYMDARLPHRLRFPLGSCVMDGDKPRVTQTFAEHPEPAKGLDISCYTGSAVLAADDGVVDKALDLGTASYGKYVEVVHPWGFTLYAHLSHITVTKGQRVPAGGVLGASGNTGNSTGPHLHFEVKSFANRVWPHRVDPAPLLGLGDDVETPEPPANDPVEPSALTAAELQHCREKWGVTPATIKAALARDYEWVGESYTPGDRYALCVVFDRATKKPKALKLDAHTWAVTSEGVL